MPGLLRGDVDVQVPGVGQLRPLHIPASLRVAVDVLSLENLVMISVWSRGSGRGRAPAWRRALSCKGQSLSARSIGRSTIFYNIIYISIQSLEPIIKNNSKNKKSRECKNYDHSVTLQLSHMHTRPGNKRKSLTCHKGDLCSLVLGCPRHDLKIIFSDRIFLADRILEHVGYRAHN